MAKTGSPPGAGSRRSRPSGTTVSSSTTTSASTGWALPSSWRPRISAKSSTGPAPWSRRRAAEWRLCARRAREYLPRRTELEFFSPDTVSDLRAIHRIRGTSMNVKLFGELAAIGLVITGLGACTVNSSKATSWGKPGVSMLDYQTDTILCGTVAENAASGNAANSAGGIDGKNAAARTGGGGDAAAAAGNSGAQS